MILIRNLSKLIKSYPVTAACLVLAVALHTAVRVDQYAHSLSFEDALWKWGAITELHLVGLPELWGSFSLWDGEVWRIPASAFHHAGVLHLLMNSLAIAFLGGLLERRMGIVRYALFLSASVVIAILPEFLLEHSAVGLSGSAYAMFGALLVVRRKDPFVARVFTAGMIRLGLLWLVLCFGLTAWDVVNVANAAHTVGLVYGYVVGWAFLRDPPVRSWLRRGLLAAHLLVPVAIYFTVHPIWLGRYHWYLAQHETDVTRRLQHWQDALEWDPSLCPVWHYVALDQMQRGDSLAAWRTVLEGLKLNRSDTEGLELARSLWQVLHASDDVETAAQIVAEVFGDEQAAWRKRLETASGSVAQEPGTVVSAASTGASEGHRQPVDLPSLKTLLDQSTDLAPPSAAAPRLDPDAPDSAGEGVTI